MMCETLVFVYGLYIYHTYVLVRSLLCVHTYVRAEKKGSHCFGVFRLVAIDEKGLHQLHRMALSPKGMSDISYAFLANLTQRTRYYYLYVIYVV